MGAWFWAVAIVTIAIWTALGLSVILLASKNKRVEDARQRQRERDFDRMMARVQMRVDIESGRVKDGIHFYPGVGLIEIKNGAEGEDEGT